TTANTLTKVTGAPSTAIIASTSDTGGVVGITTSGAGVTSNATIQINGQVNCVFDNATTAGDYVQISSTTSGNCHDASSSYPTSGQVVGRVLSTNASAGTYQIDLFPAEIKPSNLVTSVFGRTGAVAATSGDYTASQVTNAFDTSTNNNIGTHYFDIGTEAAPANPSAGAIRLYADSTSGNLTCLTSAGGNCLPSSGGGGNVSTSGTVTTGYLPKFASSTTITNSAADDGVTTANTFTYAGSGGVAAPNGPLTSGSPSAAAAAALPSGAHGIAADESSTAGVPAAGVDYLKADSASHCWKASVNGGPSACVLTTLSGFGLFQPLISVPTISSLNMPTGLNQQASFSITNNSAGVSLADTVSTGATDHIEGVLGTYPGTAFTATGLFSVPQIYANFIQFGVLAAQSTSGKLTTWMAIDSSGWKVEVANYTGVNTNPASTSATCTMLLSPYIWLQYKDDGTNLYFNISSDGINFQQCYTVAKSSAYLAGNFNYFGIFIAPEGVVFGTNLLSWTVTNP
ncbi:MAG: hypothetical protein KGL39_57080, partial [Patescibacteria group bacterium]|nr:hypothetical protein [Patescibacteria group bacterium]